MPVARNVWFPNLCLYARSPSACSPRQRREKRRPSHFRCSDVDSLRNPGSHRLRQMHWCCDSKRFKVFCLQAFENEELYVEAGAEVCVQSILSKINWRTVNRRTRLEVRNREVHCPPISLFRWWARRPHSLVASLLRSSGLASGSVVGDPFSGGGTVTLEALRMGLRVYAQDINPWPVWGLKTALDEVSSTDLRRAVDRFLAAARQKASSSYQGECGSHGKSEILNTFRVRVCRCKRCRRDFYLFPYSLITLASRKSNEQSGYFGCRKCGAVSCCKVNAARPRCHSCGHSLANPRKALLVGKRIVCPHCQCSNASEWRSNPRWKAVLVQRCCRIKGKELVHFDADVGSDDAPRRHAQVPTPLVRPIPDGRETKTLKRGGFRRWCDLYPPRQLRALVKAAEICRDLRLSSALQNRLLLALAGASEMPGFLCRWDRFHPKIFEALANHRFAVTGLAVESNVFASRGRGTLERRLNASIRAAEWREKIHPERVNDAATIVCGTSERQLMCSGSVQLVVTDPPYFDSVQYGELSTLLLVWAEVVTGETRRWQLDWKGEAVPNPTRGVNAVQHEQILSRIFAETARVLSKSGVLVLTYHSTNFRGWLSVGRALDAAGFRITALATAHSENETDHAKRGRRSFRRDLVIECRKRTTHRSPLVVTSTRTAEQRELVAAGRTIARCGAKRYEYIAAEFVRLQSRLRTRRIHVPRITDAQD